MKDIALESERNTFTPHLQPRMPCQGDLEFGRGAFDLGGTCRRDQPLSGKYQNRKISFSDFVSQEISI